MASNLKNNTEKAINGSNNQEIPKTDVPAKNIEFQSLTVHGAQYKTLLTSKYLNRKKWENPNEKLIFSFIPGTIKEVYVHTGQKVEKDTPFLILNAMKMENTVYAPFSGTLKLVNVEPGERIPKGRLMVEFE